MATFADILDLPADELERLVAGLLQGTISSSSSVAKLRGAGVLSHPERIQRWLKSAHEPFGTPTALAAALRLVLEERQRSERRALAPELIVTGPEAEGVEARETRVVVRELFESARRSVLVVGFAFYESDRIFEPLARRMSRRAALKVRLVVNVPIERGQSVEKTISAFARRFLKENWPFEPRPEMYFDRRSLENAGAMRASVHAKLIVVDEETLFVGSANFTSAAFERNIEAGLRVKSARLARTAAQQFERWITHGDLIALPLPAGGP